VRDERGGGGLPNYRPQLERASTEKFMRELESLMRKHGMNPITDEEQERQNDNEAQDVRQSRQIRCDQYQVMVNRFMNPELSQTCNFGKATPSVLFQFGKTLIREAVKQKPVLMLELLLWTRSLLHSLPNAQARPQEDQP
jgi:hypothetical protein